RSEVIHHIAEILKTEYGNPSSAHSYGRSAKSLLENARKQVAAHLNVTAPEIIFTSGGTEADNLILQSCVRDLGVQRIVSSKIEHHAVLHCIQKLEADNNIEVAYVNLDERGQVDHDHLEQLLLGASKKTLVSLMHVNNELGNMLDLDRTAQLCKAHNALFHSDMVQSIGHFEVDFSKTPVDFSAVSAHKFHGPKGAGFAFVRKNSGLRACILGGAQERGLRAGTEAVYAISGMVEALKLSYLNLEKEREYVLGLKNYFKQKLKTELPGTHFNGACEDDSCSTYTLLNACLPLPPEKAMLLLFQLDLNGIACSQGSACQSGSAGGSHVLNEVLPKAHAGKPSVRFSFSSFNTKDEIDYVVGVLKEFAGS
ncbi:MAG: cysteine desulfurase family protein, partial [Marinirhabdus sp.]